MRAPALAYGAAVAYLTGLFLQLLHYGQHATERNEPPLLVHWLRDSTLSLPLCVVGAAAGLWIAARLAEEHGPDTWLEPIAVAGACSAFLMAAQPLHGVLFEAHHAHEINPLVHALRDGLYAFGCTLPVAAAVFTLRGRRRPLLLRGPGITCATVVVALAPVGVLAASVGANAPSTARLPCPASAPVRGYAIRAIDVPALPGDRARTKMLVRAGTDDARRRQSLSLRARTGDCVLMTFTNALRGEAIGLHLEGLPFAGPTGNLRSGTTRRYRFYIPPGWRFRGSYPMTPGVGPVVSDDQRHGLNAFLDVS